MYRKLLFTGRANIKYRHIFNHLVLNNFKNPSLIFAPSIDPPTES